MIDVDKRYDKIVFEVEEKTKEILEDTDIEMNEVAVLKATNKEGEFKIKIIGRIDGIEVDE